MKRSYSEQSDLAEDSSSSSRFHLKSQNRALSLEMLRYKRQLSEARKELDMIRGKSREMESLVSIIQRAWSQLDIDASMLLDGFGDSENIAESGGNSELLYRLLHAGSNFHSLDPTDITGLPKLKVDEWSSAEELTEARAAATNALSMDRTEGQEGSSKVASDSAADLEFGGKVDETLCAHASFTLSLLERLCFVLSDSGLLDHLPESLGVIADAKALHAETFALKDRITKLSSEIIDMRSKLHVCEQKRISAEKTLDRAVTEHSRQLANGTGSTAADGAGSLSLSSESGLGLAPADDVDTLKEMSARVAILEKQLAESEGAKARAEMTLTERLARPLSQTEAQVADMRRAMEELRQQGRQRVASLLSEGAALQERVSDMEVALMALESASEQRCSQATAAASAEIKFVEAEKLNLQSSLFAAQADIATMNQLKLQVGELSILESSARSECLKLQQQIASISAAQERLQSHLSSSRGRELEYEMRLGIAQSATTLQPTTHAASSSSSNSLGGRGLSLGITGNDSSNSSSSGSGSSGKIDILGSSDSSWTAVSESKGESNGHPPVTSELDSGLSVPADSLIATEREGDPPCAGTGDVTIQMLTFKQAQERARETQIELDEARASLNDLILEIESVSVEEARSREQSARILRQMADSQAMQREVLEENLRLQEQIADLQTKHVDVENRIEIVQNVMKQQDSLITQLRSAEQAARTDIRVMKRTGADESSNRHLNEQLLIEAEQKLKLADHSVGIAKKRNVELQNRCDELSTQWEAERKLRMEAQREPKSKPAKKEKNGNSGSSAGHLNHEDAAMLEMTLGMLRCSVCKDRFKEVALTRCFHLFCKECIEENLRNRQRKCPACGDKFGQDDVKSIFFTD